VSQHPYHLQETIPGNVVAQEWNNLVTQQARALDLMLRSIRGNLDALQQHAALPAQHKVAQLKVLAHATTKSLATLAQQLVSVEQKLASLTGSGSGQRALLPEQVVLVGTLEQVVNVLHANLIAARQALMNMFQETRAEEAQPLE
jgi:hypothetical protein